MNDHLFDHVRARELAQRYGISLTTISRVLDNPPATDDLAHDDVPTPTVAVASRPADGRVPAGNDTGGREQSRRTRADDDG